MADISAGLVKQLRDKTGAGMMDCKRALIETAGDIETAVDWLRKKGLAAAAKKAGRVAADGLVAALVEGRTGVVLEVNSETDFVARNETFQLFVSRLAKLAVVVGDPLERLMAAPFPVGERTVQEEATHMVATIGENVSVRRVGYLSVDAGVVAAYVHAAVGPGLGKIGVIVALQSEAADREGLEALGKQLAMHVAAARPESVTVESIDPTLVERETAILREQARASGKPDAIIDKMVEGRLRKFYEDVVLLEQVFVIDGESRVKQVVEAAGKKLGAPITVKGFLRFALGEGIDKPPSDLASEVAETLST